MQGKKADFEGVKRVVLSDEQIKEIALGVRDEGVQFFAEKFGCKLSVIRSAVASLRKAGLIIELPPRKGAFGRYKAIAKVLYANGMVRRADLENPL